MDLKTDLLARAEAWCKATGRSRATLANKVMKDGKFFDRLERGGGCTLRSYERFLKFFDENRPSEAA